MLISDLKMSRQESECMIQKCFAQQMQTAFALSLVNPIFQNDTTGVGAVDINILYKQSTSCVSHTHAHTHKWLLSIQLHWTNRL